MKDLGSIRADLERFTQELGREEYENFSGQKDTLDTASIYARYDHIFLDEDLLDDVDVSRTARHGFDRLRMTYLYASLLSTFIGRKTTEVTDKIGTFESKAEVEVEGKKVPFHYTSVMLSNEPDHNKREFIFNAQEPVFNELNPLLLERLDKTVDVVEGLGYDTYFDMCVDMNGIDLLDLKKRMESFLGRTERLYLRYFKIMSKDLLGLNIADVRRHDIGFLFRAKEFDRFFKSDDMLRVVNHTLDGMGLSLKDNKNIRLDTEVREKKRPRAFCAPIKVPEEVYLCIMPQGGMNDYRAFLHEMGHSQHFGNVSPDQPYEYKYLGDNSVTEAYAFLFDHLGQNKTWLEQHFDVKEEEAFRIIQFTSFQKLYMLRRYAAKLIYEIELHRGIEHPEKVYTVTLEGALKFKQPENHYLYDMDSFFYSANYLRAWMFEVQLSNALVDRFGTAWWETKDCGKYLKELWSVGQKFNCDQLAKSLGYYGIDEYPMVRELERNLRY